MEVDKDAEEVADMVMDTQVNMVVEDIKVDKVADDVSDMMMDMEDKPGQVMEIFLRWQGFIVYAPGQHI